MPLKSILYVDIEGGWGGSSRSLYYLIKNMEKMRFRPIVLFGKNGPVIEKYKSESIETYIFTPIPRTTSMEKKNIRAVLAFLRKIPALPELFLLTRKIIKKFNISIIHMNHESLFFFGLVCRLLFHCRIVYHVRTMLPRNAWAKIQVYIAVKTADQLIFISENERERWHSILAKSKLSKQIVVHNIAESRRLNDPSTSIGTAMHQFKVLSLMTISYRRGTDRLVDVAQFLKEKGYINMIFIICGKSEGNCEKDMRGRIKAKKLDDYFLFLGHQTDPESILASCDILIRPSREYNPWGRDVIEAITLGKPVLAIGSYQKFVQDGINGYLLAEFNVREIAERIIYLSEHPEIIEKMRESNIGKARRLFNGRTNAKKIERIYESF